VSAAKFVRGAAALAGDLAPALGVHACKASPGSRTVVVEGRHVLSFRCPRVYARRWSGLSRPPFP
jgi:hypothetical protein